MMIFLPGKHVLSKKLVIEGTTDLNMVGADNCLPGFDSGIQKPIKSVKISLKANLTVEGASYLNISGLIVDGRSENIMTILTVGIAEFVVSIENITVVRSGLLLWAQNRLFSNHDGVIILSNTTFVSSTVLFDFERTNEIVLKNVVFFLGSARSAVTFCSLISSVSMQNIEIVTLDSDDESAPGPALRCCSDLFHFQVKRTCDVVLYLANGFIIDLNRSISVLISDSSLSRRYGAGVCAPNPPAGEQWRWFLKIIIDNSLISNHAEGGIDMETGYIKNLSLSLINTVISSNINRSLSASALSVQKSTKENNEDANIIVKVINTTFEGNNHMILGEQQTTVFLSGVTNIAFENCRFINNYGSAIRAISMNELRFVGQNILRNNTGYRGGALYLRGSVIGLEENSSMIFEENRAKDIGGAIYIDDSTSVPCFLQLLNHHESSRCWSSCPENETCFGLKFIANLAANGGESIFGPIQQPCDLKHLDCAFQTSNRFSYSSLASTPTRVCLCPEERSKTTIKQYCTNTSLIFNSKSVYPGEEFHLEAVLVGELFGTGMGSIYPQFMDLGNRKEGEMATLKPDYQFSQRVNNYNICQQLNYTIYSHKSEEVLVLTTSGTVVVSFTDKKDLKNDLRDGDRNFKTILSTPVYINLTLLPCPTGFYT
jgi:predicted outer membrane repeat protein